MAGGPVTYTDKGGGGSLPPHGEDFFNRIVNVHWPRRGAVGGAFSFAGNIFLDIVTPPTEGNMGGVVSEFTWLGGASDDGEKWKESSSKSGLALFCCVRGKVGERYVTVAAGTVVVGPSNFGPGYSTGYGSEPAGGVSYDGGQNWGDIGIPLQQWILKPPNPITGQGGDTAQGVCKAVAYHPASQSFYIGGSVIFSVGADTYWEDRLYRGATQVYSERRESTAPFLGYRWPIGGIAELNEQLVVADMTQTTPAGPTTRFAVSFGPSQQVEYLTSGNEPVYLSVNKDGAGATFSPPLAVVNSICGGKGHIVAVGWQDEDRRIGPVTVVSDDDGVHWTPQLSGLIHVNPELEDKNSGSSAGSCSFS